MGGKRKKDVLQEFLELCKETESGPAAIQYRAASRSWAYDGEPVGERDLVHLIAIRLETSDNTAMSVIRCAHLLKAREASERIERWVAEVEAAGVDDGPLREFVTAMARPDTEGLLLECHIWAMKQWIWQVKRNVLRKAVTYHIMPIFWSGAQGTGKTYNINRLVAPLDDFKASLRVSDLTDRFSKKLLSRTLVAVFDEFAGAEHTDKETFKSLLTGRPLEGREMYGDSGIKFENRLSCIAASNLAPPHGFEDPTGARRLWAIECTPISKGDDPLGRERMDALDWAGIWRAVSAYGPPLYEQMPDHIRRAMQAEREARLRCQDSLESFMQDALLPVAPAEGARLHFRDFQALYRDYCTRTGLKRIRFSYSRLHARLTENGFHCTRTNNQPRLHNYIEKPIDDAPEVARQAS